MAGAVIFMSGVFWGLYALYGLSVGNMDIVFQCGVASLVMMAMGAQSL